MVSSFILTALPGKTKNPACYIRQELMKMTVSVEL